jgi:hypothetical protein
LPENVVGAPHGRSTETTYSISIAQREFISLIGGAAASWSSAIVAHSADRTPTMLCVTTGLQGKK